MVIDVRDFNVRILYELLDAKPKKVRVVSTDIVSSRVPWPALSSVFKQYRLIKAYRKCFREDYADSSDEDESEGA